MKQVLLFFVCIGLALFSLQCKKLSDQDVDLKYVVYKKIEDFYTLSQSQDPTLKNTLIDFDQNIISEILIEEPGLYLFVDLEGNRTRLVYFKKPAEEKQYKIKHHHESLKWLEEYLDTFKDSELIEEDPVAFVGMYDLPSGYHQKVDDIVAYTGVDKNVLLSIIQDWYMGKFVLMNIVNISSPDCLKGAEEIITQQQYHYNYLSNGIIMIDQMYGWKPHYIDSNTFNFISLQNEYKYTDIIEKNTLEIYQDLLDSMSVHLPDLYSRAPSLFSVSNNILRAGGHYKVLNDQRDSVLVIDYMTEDYTLFYFWGTWCYPCKVFEKEKMSELIALASQHNIPIITIAAENINDFNLWEKSLEGNKKELINFFAFGKFKEGSVGLAIHHLLAALNINSFPSLMLVDQKGNILITKDVSGEKTIQYLQTL